MVQEQLDYQFVQLCSCHVAMKEQAKILQNQLKINKSNKSQSQSKICLPVTCRRLGVRAVRLEDIADRRENRSADNSVHGSGGGFLVGWVRMGECLFS